MNYKQILKGYATPIPVVIPTTDTTNTTNENIESLRSEDDVDLMMQFMDHLHREYFTNIPYNTDEIKKHLINIPDDMFNYITKLFDIDAPIICNPLTNIYGLYLSDRDMYPNYVNVLLEYYAGEDMEIHDYINRNKQLIVIEGDDEE